MNWELQTRDRPGLAKLAEQPSRRKASEISKVIASIEAHDPNAAAQFEAMWSAYDKELEAYLARERPFWAEKLGVRSGTLTNLESGLAWMATLGTTDLNAGCLQVQSKTLRVLRKALESWPASERLWRPEPRVVGNIFEHHAVVVIPIGKAVKKAWYFDPWITQQPEIYAPEVWMREFSLIKHFGEERLDW